MSNRDASIGASFDYALGSRAPRAVHRRALLSREQSAEALRNLEQLAQVDVRTGYVEVVRAREQIVANAVASRAKAEVLRSEQEKFRVGKSTALSVAQANRDLLLSRLGEVQAVVALHKALITLYRRDGSLLQRRGISAP